MDPSRCDRGSSRAPKMLLRPRAEGSRAARGDRARLLRTRSPGPCLLPRGLPAPPLRAHGRGVRRRARHGGLGRGARLDGHRRRRAPQAVPRGHEGPVERGPGRPSRRDRRPGAGEPALGTRRLDGAWALLECHKPRGREAIDAIGVMGKMAGVAVQDGWKPFRTHDVVYACATRTTYASSRRSGRLSTRAGRRRWGSVSRQRGCGPSEQLRRAKHRVGLCVPRACSSWVNPIECRFVPCHWLVLNNSHHPRRLVVARSIDAYLTWHNANALHYSTCSPPGAKRVPASALHDSAAGVPLLPGRYVTWLNQRVQQPLDILRCSGLTTSRMETSAPWAVCKGEGARGFVAPGVSRAQ